MDVTLIICTRDRCKQLERCLEAVRNIRFGGSWELMIVDNGSVDETQLTVRHFIATFPVRARYVFEPKPGLGNARNAGLRVAQGKILAFTDDDCYPAPDFLSRIWSSFDGPSVGYITGRITLHDAADHPITIQESETPLTFQARSFIKVGAVAGANMAFRREVLLQIGGFDPWFGPGSHFNAEELDAAGRASSIGWVGRYCPEVVVRHHHGRKAADAPRLWKSYGIGAGAYHMKLLLNGKELLWFVQSVYQFPRRAKISRRMVFWEPVGACKYACVYLAHAFCDRLRPSLFRSRTKREAR
jgi:glycosyltransferase involved in cell wall biosynthesis